MILVLLTGFSISTLPFQIVSAPEGHSVSTIFETYEISMQELLHAYSSLCASKILFGPHYEDDVTTKCVNSFLRAREARD